MNTLPNYEFAVIEDSKLVGYALNPQKERGQHKARVFESALGFNVTNWQQLKYSILRGLSTSAAIKLSETVFGSKYQVVLPITGVNGRTVDVMTVWQFDRLPDGSLNSVARLITVYVV